MITSNALTSSATAPPAPVSSSLATASNAAVSQEMFLKLLVEQLKHQDPLNPADGTQFVAQLAQFSNLEQTAQMREDLDAILKQLTAGTAPPAAPAAGS